MNQPVCKHCGRVVVGEQGWERHADTMKFLCAGQSENVAEVREEVELARAA